MPRCSSYTAHHHQCINQATIGLDGVPDHTPLCRIHARSYRLTVRRFEGIHVLAHSCLHAHGRGWCNQDRVEGSAYCQGHLNYHAQRATLREQNEARRAERRLHRNGILEELLARNPQPTWQMAMLEVFNRHDLPEMTRYQIAFSFFIRVEDEMNIPVFRIAWEALLDAHAPPPPPPPPARTTLAALAADTQNVHTRAVVTQTQELETLLLAVPVPESQQTESGLVQAWLALPANRFSSWGRILKTMNDIHLWFGTPNCRRENDNLYRRLLRGVVAKINRTDTELRPELYQRLWEECYEAVGMCCEGHISRLCNVFVGFDDAFRPPVSLGELLQSKMSVIAGLDIPDEDKRRQATAFFDEHGIPAEERTAWLEAF